MSGSRSGKSRAFSTEENPNRSRERSSNETRRVIHVKNSGSFEIEMDV
jgi:hypothetical protein